MSACLICKKPLTEGKSVTVKARGVKSLIDRAIAKGHEDHEQFLRTVSEVTLHTFCYKHYSDSRTDNVVRCRSSSSSSSSSILEAPLTDFNFLNNCFICSEAIIDQSQVSKNRQRRVCNVRNQSFKNTVLNLLSQRSDEFAIQILNRITNVPDLVAVGAKYHYDCSKRLYIKNKKSIKKSNERKNNIDEAMEFIFSYLTENSEECQFNMTDLVKAIEGDYVPDKRTIKERLQEKYGDEILFYEEKGRDTIICFKGFFYEIMSKKLSSNKKNDPREERLQKIREAAGIILEDIRSQRYETNKYPPSDEFLKDVESVIPETLSVLLSEIICKSKRRSLDAVQRKCTTIAHSIIAATRPASFISPLLLGVGAFLYKKYGSSNLIDVLSSLGFSASYNSVSPFEDSCAFRPARKILPQVFSQFVFDNADFNSNTIDGRNTFHEMGGIQCVAPYNGIEADSSFPRVSKRLPASAKSTLGLIPVASY